MSQARIDVGSATSPYEVVVGHGVRAELAQLVGAADRVAVIHPAAMALRVPELCADLDAEVLAIEVPDGESAKSATVLTQCWDRLGAAGFTRSDLVIGFGGGAATDLAGFVAATWLRGVGLITVPTTVLGMVDAAVGGKTGINVSAGKNLVGAFHEQRGVLCDLDWLDTLPEAEIRAGLAEVIKCGFIADPAILEVTGGAPTAVLDPGSEELAEIISRAIAVKARVVAADLREATSVGDRVGRELLNYGHTLGHAIERHADYTIRHGEAISIGMVFVAELARLVGLADADFVQQHRDQLTAVGLPVSYAADAWPQLRSAMALDKKSRGSTLRFVVLSGLARPSILEGPDEDQLETAYRAVAR
ncbi:3-dehydroquinate synthase [Propionibacteriaceae bacterium Y1685]|uniref:3-dehydroquinate synthase n=1 Tax=Microlunatus sp. Y1700 TaxID=3418487 RepID=UPI003B827053